MDALNSCPATRQRMDEEEDGDLQTLTLFLRDMTVYFVGGGSLGAVANKQIAVIIVDEADKIPRLTGKQAHVVDEGKSRFKSVPAGDALMIVLSKPNQEVDITTVEYRKGTMEKGFMPCPHCGLLQEFLQERLRYDHCKLPGGDHDLARVLEETHYLCVQAGSAACPDGRIYDHHRTFTCDRIEYRPTNPNPEPGHRSFEVSDFLLNPVHFPDARFGRIAIDMIEGFKNPVKMKSVQAGRFGKEELLQRAELKQDDILKLRGNYRRGTAPRGLVYCGIFSDVQGSGPKWVKYGFRRNGELVVIDWGAFLVLDDLIPESLTVEIPEVDESVPLAADVDQPRTGRLLRPQQGWIDEGDEQKQVLSFCIRSSFFFLPTKGRGGYQTRGTTIVAESPRDHELQQFVAYHFNDDQFKKELYVHRIRDHEKIIAGKKPNTPRIWVPHDIDEALMLELTNERLTIKKDARGFTQEEWEKTGPNDYGDGVKGALISWHVMGPRILSELAAADKAAAAKPPPPAN
jgi:phage terminase large subunit GpA-like protein